MSSLEDYAKSERAFQNAKRLKGNHPKGWEPRIDTSKKEIVSKPQKKAGNPQDHRWDKYLEELGFNPDEFEIIEPFEIRSWDSNTENGKDTFYYYKAKIISKHAVNDRDFDFKSLLSEIKKSKPKPQTINGKSSMIVCLSDWQMGKRDGDGTKGIVERIEQMIPDVTARIKELRKSGVDLAHLYVVGLGDIVSIR